MVEKILSTKREPFRNRWFRSPTRSDIIRYRVTMSFVRESFFEFHRTINVHVEPVGQSEHVTGRAELGQVTTGDREFPPRFQAFRVDQLEFDFSGERGDGIQPGRMQRNAEHVFLIVLRQQQRTVQIIPNPNGVVDFPAGYEYGFPFARRQTGNATVMQIFAQGFEVNDRRFLKISKKKKRSV